jgi:subtilase family serine protease
MRRSSFVIAAALFVGGAILAPAQSIGRVITPSSNTSGPVGQAFNTNIEILQTAFTGAARPAGVPFPGLFYNSPASLACIYNQGYSATLYGPQCNPNQSIPNATGGSNAVAIVDAYDDPNATADLQAFSTQFGLPSITSSTFHVVYAPHGGATPGSCTGPATQPGTDPTGGWEIEESLDIEYVHGMAPGATIYLVEGQSNSNADLYCAVSTASSLVAAAGGGEVSMSWGQAEFSTEALADVVFTTPGVVYFASTGDSPGTGYPAASPNIVAVGGTTLSRNPVTGSFENENVWQDGGAGPSPFEPLPIFQAGLASARTIPDVVADANPNTGVWVLDNFVIPEYGTTFCGGTPCWIIVGGTSLSSPLWAGIVNASKTFYVSTRAEENKLYGGSRTDFTDITIGSCGLSLGYFAGPGYDICSGNGSPNGYPR